MSWWLMRVAVTGRARRELGGGSNARSQTGDGAAKGALRIDPTLCREKRHVNAVDGCGRQRAISSSVLATKHRAREVRADKAWAGTS